MPLNIHAAGWLARVYLFMTNKARSNIYVLRGLNQAPVMTWAANERVAPSVSLPQCAVWPSRCHAGASGTQSRTRRADYHSRAHALMEDGSAMTMMRDSNDGASNAANIRVLGSPAIDAARQAEPSGPMRSAGGRGASAPETAGFQALTPGSTAQKRSSATPRSAARGIDGCSLQTRAA